MRIGVLTSEQTPDSLPEHFVSKKLAERFLAYYHNGKKAVSLLSDGLLWIRVKLTFGKLKELLRTRINGIPEQLPIRDWRQCLLLTYPHRSQESQFRWNSR